MQHDRHQSRRSVACVCAAGALGLLAPYSAAAATLKTLHSFCAEQFCPDGLNPVNGLLRDPQGNLYGETFEGGAQGVGTVFQLHRPPGRDKYKVRVLHNFCSSPDECSEDGSSPGIGGHLIIDAAGNIYGTAEFMGAHEGGLVFKLTPHNSGKRWSYRTLYDFCAGENCADGQDPASLTYAGASNGAPYDGVSPLYGVAEYGGANGQGVAFQLTPKRKGPWAERVLYSFCAQSQCADGKNPAHDLVLDANGNLFGVTGAAGATDPGVVFQLSPSRGPAWTETVLHAFCAAQDCTDGRSPSGGLTMDDAGNLFGVTAFGGNAGCQGDLGCGVVYEIAADGTQSVVHAFCSVKNCADGELPTGRLALDGAGSLFGTTVYGGAHAGGTAFRLNDSKYHVVFDFCSGACGGIASEPRDGVILDADGALLGTAGGGEANLGVAYRLRP